LTAVTAIAAFFDQGTHVHLPLQLLPNVPPLSSEERTTCMMLKTFTLKRLKPRPESGRDCLIVLRIARQRKILFREGCPERHQPLAATQNGTETLTSLSPASETGLFIAHYDGLSVQQVRPGRLPCLCLSTQLAWSTAIHVLLHQPSQRNILMASSFFLTHQPLRRWQRAR